MSRLFDVEANTYQSLPYQVCGDNIANVLGAVHSQLQERTPAPRRPDMAFQKSELLQHTVCGRALFAKEDAQVPLPPRAHEFPVPAHVRR